MTDAEPIDILILSNGPGEVTTWVKPVVAALRVLHPESSSLRISVMLVPCVHASGREARVLRRYPEVDRVQEAAAFLPFLFTGRTAERWDWHRRGLVLFLGGDQLYALIAGWRLGFRILVYAERQARWRAWVDAFGVADPALIERLPARHRHKLTLVGDLMAEVHTTSAGFQKVARTLDLMPETQMIGLLVGSKRSKLRQGVPLMLALADEVAAQRPATRFVLPVAPTLDLDGLLTYASPCTNPLVSVCGGPLVTLVKPRSAGDLPHLLTAAGTRISLWEETPSHELLVRCDLCITTVGANTAELGALGVPMLVLIPTHQRDVMETWSGPLGWLVRLRLVGRPINLVMNRILLAYLRQSGRHLAWPNIRARETVVPELLGEVTAAAVGDLICDYLGQPQRLTAMSERLRGLWGPRGAGARLAALALSLADER